MVDLNFTLVVQLLMFLGFLWVMERWVLRPLLKTMDERHRGMAEDKEQAQADEETAETLENQYAAELAAAHQKAHQKISESLRAVQERHMAERNSLRESQQAEIAVVQEEAERAIEQQRDRFPELSSAIAQAMMRRLGLGGDAS
ncbi:MAG TPA: hypothetical protein ENN29_13030 [Candidatus Hydrogenedentes bacterium]|nr:hypothetical protein [Candidatus Hydrogenedentota bacterium]